MVAFQLTRSISSLPATLQSRLRLGNASTCFSSSSKQNKAKLLIETEAIYLDKGFKRHRAAQCLGRMTSVNMPYAYLCLDTLSSEFYFSLCVWCFVFCS